MDANWFWNFVLLTVLEMEARFLAHPIIADGPLNHQVSFNIGV